MGPGQAGEVPSVDVFLRNPSPYFKEFQKKTTENSEELIRQARLGIEPGTTRLPILTQNHSVTGEVFSIKRNVRLYIILTVNLFEPLLFKYSQRKI